MKNFTKHLSLLLAGLLCCACLFSCEEEDETATTTTTTAATTTISTTEEPPSTDENPVTGEAPSTDEAPSTNQQDDKQDVTDNLTHAQLFAKAREEMAKLDSYTGNSTIDMTMTMLGLPIVFTVSETTYVDAAGGRYYGTASTEIMGETSQTVTYYDEEVYFMDIDGTQFKADMTSDFLKELIGSTSDTANLGLEVFESYKVYSSDDGYIVEIVGLKDDLGLLDALIEAGLEGVELDLSAIELELRLTKDFLYTEMTMKMEMEIDMSEMDLDTEIAFGVVKLKLEATTEYSDYNASADKIEKPDMTNAEEIDLEDLLGIDTEEEVKAEII